ncbi:hypothetical protein [Corynebacterium neomassiliense]|uniref:hypothetical protein n=1 Tax=Corynebacterium neomassiliense TaxID=2079482 RepID=UPI0010308602|nr:hypothetical protein [Corynebacterium neomassiliense]
MNRGRAAFDRLVIFIVALVFAFLAVWGIGTAAGAPFASRISDHADRDFWRELPLRDNYDDILRIAAVVLVTVGLLLILVNVGRRRLGRITSPLSDPSGELRLHPADLGSAVAQTFENRPDVTSATFRALRDRATDVIEIRVRSAAETDITALRDACRLAAADIRAAFPDQDIRPRFLLQVEQVRHRN